MKKQFHSNLPAYNFLNVNFDNSPLTAFIIHLVYYHNQLFLETVYASAEFLPHFSLCWGTWRKIKQKSINYKVKRHKQHQQHHHQHNFFVEGQKSRLHCEAIWFPVLWVVIICTFQTEWVFFALEQEKAGRRWWWLNWWFFSSPRVWI